MKMCSTSLRACLLLALGIALPAAPQPAFSAYPHPPACCAPASPRYQLSDGSPQIPGIADPASPDRQDPSVQSFPDSPIDLGESAPAQSGSSFAVNDSPNMIGDLLLNTDYVFRVFNPGGQSELVYSTIALAGGDRRFKISENMSPIPRDRIYYTFNGFQRAARTVDDRVINVNRHTLGGEKTFWDGMGSLELRMPILQGLSAMQSQDGILQNDDGVEFGNITLLPKFIINEGPDFVFSGGLGINLPSARDAHFAGPQLPALTIQNDAVHLSPFLGLLWLPTENGYLISYVQADFATNGNRVLNGANVLGTLPDQNLLHFDVTLGRYLYRSDNTRLSGIAAQLELHYTTTMQDAVTLNAGPGVLGNPFNRLDLLILTGGLNFQFWNASCLTVGCAVPLRGMEDPVSGLRPEHPFDAEIQVQFNRYF